MHENSCGVNHIKRVSHSAVDATMQVLGTIYIRL